MQKINGKNEDLPTGRLMEYPNTYIHDQVLYPQFQYETKNFLGYYIAIEKVMSIEYERMGMFSSEALHSILQALDQINYHSLMADPSKNMTDILFAIEHYVKSKVPQDIALWHLDRSRNDVQATAQLMFARDQLLEIITDLHLLADCIHPLAIEHTYTKMPGYTHYQSAQIISVGFYFSGVLEQISQVVERLCFHWRSIDECPLGSGAMAGLELTWDRERIAKMLGFEKCCRHALKGVASKDFMLLIGSELSNASVTFSRFLTDFMNWGSSDYRFFDLPDHLSSISSAMPQKKNFTIFERIRGKFAHIPAYYMDIVMGQQRTPYTNMVETSKEGGSQFSILMTTMSTAIQLLTHVIPNMKFDVVHMNERCKTEFFGGFSLANQLTLTFNIPYREAQILAGKYITLMIEQHRIPEDIDVEYLQLLCVEAGYLVEISSIMLNQCFSTDEALLTKCSKGSTHPDEVLHLLSLQQQAHILKWKEITKLKEQSQTYVFC
ncbi:Argininosuccinate lyase [Paenibacillus nuruki]|uniref:argininosuccinate lyase n=1 Tax=Paenibacillus nuruki TaxID=1886670 RepID=A0A1E3LAD2_9BACL|nr:lyase family protein [Paenibacillus nuruki]ODP30125.1 Argininosuccinate lyase [Paenibacillus nuruki]